MGKVSVPVECVGVSSADDFVYRVSGKPVIPEFRLFRKLEMRLVPYVSSKLSPVRMPWVHIGLVYNKVFRIFSRNELRLAWDWSDTWVYRFAQTHVVIASQ